MNYNIYDVRDYGAEVGKLSTAAIQKAIDVCAEEGGGKVLIKGGNYITGTLFMRSNVELEIAAGAAIINSNRAVDFPYVTGQVDCEIYGGLWIEWTAAPQKAHIYAKDCENFKICGMGTIEGRYDKNSELNADFIYGRPHGIFLQNCKNYVISDLTIKESYSFNVRADECENARYNSLKIYSLKVPCSDGINSYGGRNIFIRDCVFETGDDCICIKSFYKEQTCENFHVENCSFTSVCTGFRIGPEATADARGITVSNCNFDCCSDAVKIQSSTSASFEDIAFSNLVMRNCDKPIFITANSFTFDPTGDCRPKNSRVENVTFNNVIIDYKGVKKFEDVVPYTMRGIIISASEGHCISGINFNNLTMKYTGGIIEEQDETELIDFIDSTQDYVEIYKLYRKALPASAMFIRGAERCKFVNTDISFYEKDVRTAILIQHCRDVEFNGVSVEGATVAVKDYGSVNTVCKNCDEEFCLTVDGVALEKYTAFRELTAKVNAVYDNEGYAMEYMRHNTVKQMEVAPSLCLESAENKIYEYKITGKFSGYLYLPWFKGSFQAFINGELVYERIIPSPYNNITAYIAFPCDFTKDDNVLKIIVLTEGNTDAGIYKNVQLRRIFNA